MLRNLILVGLIFLIAGAALRGIVFSSPTRPDSMFIAVRTINELNAIERGGFFNPRTLHLKFTGANVDSGVVSAINKVDGLHSLDLSDCRLQQGAFGTLRTYSLEVLDVSGTNVSAEDIRELYRLPRLNHFNLRKVDVTPDIAEAIRAMKQLQVLSLSTPSNFEAFYAQEALVHAICEANPNLFILY